MRRIVLRFGLAVSTVSAGGIDAPGATRDLPSGGCKKRKHRAGEKFRDRRRLLAADEANKKESW